MEETFWLRELWKEKAAVLKEFDVFGGCSL
jgi:hypothetical protein